MKGRFRDAFASHGPARTLIFFIIAGLVLSVVLMTTTFVYLAIQGQNDKEYIELLGEQRVLSQALAKYTGEAAGGDVGAFAGLRDARDRFANNMHALRHGNPRTGLPPSPEPVAQHLEDLEGVWNGYRDNVDTILSRQEVIAALRNHVQSIRDDIPRLLALSDEVVTLMAQQGAAPSQVYIAGRQLMLTQRIENRVGDVLAGREDAVAAADRFFRDVALFGRVVEGMLEGSRALGITRVTNEQIRARLMEIRDISAGINLHVGSILERSPESFEVAAAAQQVSSASDEVLARVSALADAYTVETDKRDALYLAAGMFGAVGVALLIIIGYLLRKEALQRLAETAERNRLSEEQNARNQEAILRLLDEMGDLADGDLTVTATVNEDVTGAIADSINYAIETLRNLVTAINDTTQQVSAAAQRTQGTAVHLAEASEHQAEQITAVTSAINDMADSIEDVSSNAGQLAGEAQNSVQIASKGAEAVRKTGQGMDAIREQIQETSKRIKRLGESSQEIGDIVELINDIAEQTNILALNAAIQAAMAGDAGRGFAVVADEVQRLAERSSDATKQIEALVKTIQADTNEAVLSMEQSTSGVVAGAKLAEDAGKALEEIETVSTRLASLIQSISNSARQQAAAAANLSDTMNVIQEITSQTTAGTKETAGSVGTLAELANELRKSVAGFKLPA